MDKIALFVSYFLPKSVKYYAMLDWLDELQVDHVTIDDATYVATIEKVLK